MQWSGSIKQGGEVLSFNGTVQVQNTFYDSTGGGLRLTDNASGSRGANPGTGSGLRLGPGCEAKKESAEEGQGDSSNLQKTIMFLLTPSPGQHRLRCGRRRSSRCIPHLPGPNLLGQPQWKLWCSQWPTSLRADQLLLRRRHLALQRQPSALTSQVQLLGHIRGGSARSVQYGWTRTAMGVRTRARTGEHDTSDNAIRVTSDCLLCVGVRHGQLQHHRRPRILLVGYSCRQTVPTDGTSSCE